MDWALDKAMNAIAAGMISYFAVVIAVADVSGIEKLIATFGTLIALAWYMYQNTKVTIPTIHKENREAIEKLSTAHSESQKHLGNLFTDSLKEERESRERQAKEFQDCLRDVAGTCKWKNDK